MLTDALQDHYDQDQKMETLRQHIGEYVRLKKAKVCIDCGAREMPRYWNRCVPCMSKALRHTLPW